MILIWKIPLFLLNTMSLKKVANSRNTNSLRIRYTIIAHESFEITRHSVYQTDGHEVENALAFEVKNDETDKLILLLSEDICIGEKLCLVDGTKMRGKCLVYDKINERMIRLQC